MDGDEIVAKTKELHMPVGSYVVFGSCPMALAGIRLSSDIDMLVSAEQYEEFAKLGWQEVVKSPTDKPLTYGDFEAHDNWAFTSYKPTLKSLLATATVVNGVPFASLEEVRKWKIASARPKDLLDVKLIDEHLASH